jgi:hypothetical protein
MGGGGADNGARTALFVHWAASQIVRSRGVFSDYSNTPTTLVEFSLERTKSGMLLRISESGFDHLPDDLGQEAAYRLFGPEDDRDGDSDLWKIALALALAGDSASAEKLAKELNENYPQHTIIQRYWLPIIHAAIVLEHTNADQFCFLCIALLWRDALI